MTKYDTQGAFDKLGQDPFLPPAPAPRKSRKGWVIAGLVVGAILIGGAMSETENPTSAISTSDPVDTVQVDEPTITAEMVVDVMGQGQVNQFCSAYFALGDYDAGLAQFTGGYGTSQDPSAEEVFDELLSRC